MDTKEKDRIYKACHRFLNHHYRQTPQQVLSELATMPDGCMKKL